MLGEFVDKKKRYIDCRPFLDEETKEKILVCSVKIPGSDRDGIDSEGVKVAEVVFNLDEKGKPSTIRSIQTDTAGSDSEIIKILKKYVGNRRW